MATIEKASQVVLRRCSDLGIEPPNSLQDFVEEVQLAIFNHCNILEVPDELLYTWVGMTIDYLQWMRSARKLSSEESEPGKSSTPTMLTSIREGDTTLGFSSDANNPDVKNSGAHSMEKALDRIVLNYEDALNRFRRVVW